MCSFIYSSSGSLSGDCNERLVLRGPDNTSHVEINGHAFVHNHLSIFSKEHEQPYVDNEREVVLMFNGEIYNTPPTLSEGQFILETYKESGVAGFASLDGEFAILIADFSEQALILVTDPFATKPIFYSRSRGLWASSFSSSLVNCGVQPQTISKVPANTAVCLSMVDRCLIEQRELVKWRLDQTETSFDAWTEVMKVFSLVFHRATTLARSIAIF